MVDDETHQKCSLKSINGTNGLEYITRVKRDSNGNHCINITAPDDNPADVDVKYEKELRYALGVAMIQKMNGSVVGVRIPEFEYTEKNHHR